MNSYELSRSWFDYCYLHPEKFKPTHTAIYFMAIEHCNRLGWKEKFGFPTSMVMEAIGVKSYNTYIKCLTEIVEAGFIKMIEKSKNQYSANIIALSNNDKAHNKALDKALSKHGTKHCRSTQQSIDSINKQYNKEQYNNKTIELLKKHHELINKNLGKWIKNELSQSEIENSLIGDKLVYFDKWLKYRKEIKKEIKNESTLMSLIEKFNSEPESKVKFVVDLSIQNGWQGLFWDKYEDKPKVKKSGYDKFI